MRKLWLRMRILKLGGLRRYVKKRKMPYISRTE
jgi:hypothetical protein